VAPAYHRIMSAPHRGANRRACKLNFVKDGHLRLGLDLGGTEIKAVVPTDDNGVLWSAQVDTFAAEGRDSVLDRMVQLIATAASAVAPRTIETLGVAIPGVVDPEAGRIELLTNLTADWNGFGVQAALEARTGLPVALLNDVRAATLAEHTVGAGQGYNDFICVAIGTGVGGGLVLGGRLFLGSRGAAGEIGHVTVVPDGRRCNCGNVGCLETEASGPAIVRAACDAIQDGDTELEELAGSRQPTPLQIAQAAERGSASAHAIFAHAGTMLGRALAGLVCVLNPQAIVVGGGVAKAGDLLLDPIRAEIARRTVVFMPQRGGVEVLPSSLDGRAGAIGAAVWSQAYLKGRADVG
jgi:glucokinase